jgi:cell division protein FtsW
MDFINKMFRVDRVVWIIFIILCLISIVEVYSASSTLTFRTDDYWAPIMRHTTFLLSGMVIVLGVHAIKPKYFAMLGVCLPFAVILLIATRIFGTPVNGSYRWIEIVGIRFQPSEIAKLCLVTLTALLISKRKDKRKDKSFKWICIVSFITCSIIFIDNGSTALLLGLVIFLMMFVGKIPVFREIGKLILRLIEGLLFCILYFIPDEQIEKTFPKLVIRKKLFKRGASVFILFIVLIAGILCVIHFVPNDKVNELFSRSSTWKDRVAEFRSEVDVKRKDYKITDDNFQSAHGCIAIANGGIFGKLPGNGQERNTLPQAYSDFIYSIIIEEMGLIGGIGVISLYVMLFIRAGIIANRCDKIFPKILVMGIAMLFVIQALSNMAVAVHLIPVTGQPMPLISRGGTSTWINCIYIGILLSVSRYENPLGAKREEEIVQELEEQQSVKDEEEQTNDE